MLPQDLLSHILQSRLVERIGALGPMVSVYCRDPDGNLIELASYLGKL